MKSFILIWWIIFLIGTSVWLRLPTDKYPIREGRELLAQILISILFLMEITGHLRQRQTYRNGRLALLLGWIFFSNILYYNWWTMQMLINVALFTYLYITTIRHIALAEIEKVLKVLCWLIVFQCGYCLVQLLQYDCIYFDKFSKVLANRPVGTLENEAIFGAYLAFLIPLCFIWKKWRWNIVGVTGIAFLIISQSMRAEAQSLTALISGFTGLTVYLFLRSKKALAVILAVLILGGMVACKMGQIELEDKAVKIWAFTKEPVYSLDLHDCGRIGHWKESLKLSRRKSWWGTGIGSYRVLMPQYMKKTRQTCRFYKQAHSEPIQILVELGIIGLVLYILFVADIFRKMWRVRHDWRMQAVIAGFTAFMVNSLLYFPIHITHLVCPIIFFLCITEVIGGNA